MLWKLPDSPDVATVRHYERRVYVSKSHEELGQSLALSEEDGQNCRKKPQGINQGYRNTSKHENGP